MARKIETTRPQTFAKPANLAGRHFLITDAAARPSPFRAGETVVDLSYQLITPRADDEMPASGTITMGINGRAWLVDAFRASAEPVGPCTFVRTYLQNGLPFWNMVDVPEGAPETEDVPDDDSVPF
jgi:hypothetical protein